MPGHSIPDYWNFTVLYCSIFGYRTNSSINFPTLQLANCPVGNEAPNAKGKVQSKKRLAKTVSEGVAYFPIDTTIYRVAIKSLDIQY